MLKYKGELIVGKKIKTFSDGSFLEYDRGKFDEWCVYLTDANGQRKPPRDTDYFADIKELSERYGVDKIYYDYVNVYEITGKEKSDGDLEMITDIAKTYGADELRVDTVFSILYMAMIAEENKEHTKLGKRIKRLGIHTLLKDGRSVSDAANFMRGKSWQEIDQLCKERGF